MGQEAIIFYGVPVESDEYFEVDTPGDPELLEMDSDQKEQLEDELYYDKSGLKPAIVGNVAVGYGMTYASIGVSQVNVGWGAESFSPEKLKSEPEWDTMLREFCDRHGIPFTEPRWYLGAYYG